MPELAASALFNTGIASRQDDAELRRLLRENPMDGRIALCFEREPNFFLAATIEGEHHRTVVCRRAGRVIGLGTRSSRLAYLNGSVGRLGYLSQLRLDREVRALGLLRAGFREIRANHDGAECRLYFTTIMEDNLVARRVLEADWKDKPHYERRGLLYTLVVPLSRFRRAGPSRGVSIERATDADLEPIADCLQRNGARFQLSPYWTAEALRDPETCRGLRPTDFFTARVKGRLAGVLAIWDQSGFKQTVVQGYSGLLRPLRPLLNGLRPLTGLPQFPRPGEPFLHLYASHLAVDADDPGVFTALLAGALTSCRGRGYAYLTLGLCQGHPLLPVALKRFSPLVYRSVLYLAYYEEDAALARGLMAGNPHVEIAVM